MKNLRDPRLTLVVKAAYNLGLFNGREEEAEKVQKEMALARSAIHCLAEEVKFLDQMDKGGAIKIDPVIARAARAALRKTGKKGYLSFADTIDRKLKALEHTS